MPSLQDNLRLDVAEEGGRVTVSFPPNTTLSETNAEAFARETASAAARTSPPRLCIDLSNVEMLTSVILGKIIALNARVRSANGELSLINTTPDVYGVFTLTRLVKILDISPPA